MSIAEEYSAVREIAESHREDLIEADQVLKEICQANRKPTYAEATFFQRECGWNDLDVRQQLRRTSSVVRLRAVAGSAEDREAAAVEAETAAKLLESEGPKIREKLDKLQRQLDALERDQRLSQKRCEEQGQAVEQLRTLVPDHIRGSVQSAVSTIKNSLGREISSAEIRINELECCLSPDRYQNEQAYHEALRRSFRDAVIVGNKSGFITLALSPAWPGIRVEIENELATLTERLETLRGEFSAAMAEATAPLNYYAG